MKLTVIGCGNAFHAGNRRQSCYLLETEDSRLLLDCGADTSLSLKQAKIALTEIDAILISHCHGDHIAGLPFLYLDRLFKTKNDKRLVVYGPPGIERRLEALIDGLYPGLRELPSSFKFEVREVPPGTAFQWRAVSITPFEVKHFAGADTLSYAYAIASATKRFAYSGDSGWCAGILEAGRAADLYLIECSTQQPKYENHLDYETLSSKFEEIRAKRYVLTHMDEDMLNAHTLVDPTRCILAEDGLAIEF